MALLLSTRIQHQLERRLLGVLGCLFCGLAGGCESAVDGTRANVVLITLDTLRADQLKAYGNAAVGAPFLAELASNGTVFENAYSSSSWTAPSTASLLTGGYPDRHGIAQGFLVQLQGATTADEIRLQAISARTPTLAETLRDSGYKTFGVAANVNVGAEMQFDRGFDRFVRERQMSAEKMGELVLSWKEEMRAAEPFFLYLHLNDVHKPYDLREEWFAQAEGEPAATLARYRSELGYMDHFLERLWKDLGLGEQDLVVVVSDHGEEFLDHGGWGHHFSLYDELNRIVFFVHAPGLGIRRGQRISTPVSIIDVEPTIRELIGLPRVSGTAEQDPDGVSLAFLLHPAREEGRDGQPDPRIGKLMRPLFAHRMESEQELWSVLDGRYKLIEGAAGLELYDLETDPRETKNLVEEKREVVSGLLEALRAHQERAAGHASESTRVPIDHELLEHLQELGYVR